MASVVQQMRLLSIQTSVALPGPPLKTNKVSMSRSVSCTSSLYASATALRNLKLKQTHNRFCYLTSVPPLNPRRTAPRIVQPIAGRVCPLTGKKSNNANKVSFSQKKTKKLQKVNLQAKKIWWEAGKRMVKLRISTKALRTIAKKGLDAMAKEAGIDLRKL